MKSIIINNYDSTVKRGLINSETSKEDFINKLFEENKLDFKEVADIILVCLNCAYHYNIDIEKELKNKIQKNYNR
jgi:NTP pyrophosphatase (non-canonical NTP hydrolase)